MKGLFKRELRLAGKKQLLLFIVFVIFVIVHVMFLLSFRFGNLSHDDFISEYAVLKSIIEKIFFAELAILMLGAGAFQVSVYEDAKNGWMQYSYTLPGDIERSIRAKFTGIVTYDLCALAIGSLWAIGASGLAGKSMTASDWKGMICIWFVLVALICMTTAVCYLTKDINKTILLIGIALVPFFALFAIRMSGLDNEAEVMQQMIEWKNTVGRIIRDRWYLVVAVSACLGIGSYFASVKIMKRRKR